MARSFVAAAAVAALVGLTGCAYVPESGPPVPVTDPGLKRLGESPDPVNADLPGPSGEASASVSAYLNAVRSTRNTNLLGDTFLAAKAKTAFTENSLVTVLDTIRPTVKAVGGDNVTVTFAGSLLGTVDDDGVFQSGGGHDWSRQVQMTRQRGVWHFVDPPPVVLNSDDFGSEFSPTTVYYAAQAGGVAGAEPRLVVPEVRYVDNDAGGITTQVVDYLLAGPSRSLSSVARNPLLPGIKRTSRVTVDGGDLVVELSPEAESAHADAIDAFVAEVAWSLRAEFTGRVRLLVGGRPLQVRGVSPVQSESSWQQFNPAASTEPLPDYRVQRGAIVRSETTPETAPAGPRLDAPIAHTGVQTAAVSVDLSRLAVVRAQNVGGKVQQRLWITDASGTLQPTLVAPAIGRPSWGGSDVTVTVPIGGRIYEVGVGNAADPVTVPVVEIGGRPVLDVQAVRIALDGVRALVVAGKGPTARVYVGALVPSLNAAGAPTLIVRRLAVSGTPADVAWFGPVTAAVAVRGAGGRVAVAFAPVDGSPGRLQDTGVVGSDPVRLAADPAADPTVNPATTVPVEIGGQLYGVNSNGPRSSTVLPDAGAPFYPG